MAGTGYATAIVAGLPDIVFASSGDPLPPTFAIYPTWVAHFCLAAVLVSLIVLHVAGGALPPVRPEGRTVPADVL